MPYCYVCEIEVDPKKWDHHALEHRQEDDLNDKKNRAWYDRQVQDDFQKECDDFWQNAKDHLK